MPKKTQKARPSGIPAIPDLLNLPPWGVPADGRLLWQGVTWERLLAALRAAVPINPGIQINPGIRVSSGHSGEETRLRFTHFQMRTFDQLIARDEPLRCQTEKLNSEVFVLDKRRQELLDQVTKLKLIKKTKRVTSLMESKEAEINLSESRIQSLLSESRAICIQLGDLGSADLDLFTDHISVLIYRLNTFFLSDVPEMSPGADHATGNILGEKITATENLIPDFLRETYYSFVLNEFPRIGDAYRQIETANQPGQAGIETSHPVEELPSAFDGLGLGPEAAAVIANTCRVCGLYSGEGKTWKCSCKAVRYCSRKCQTDDWGDHKLTCTARKIPEGQVPCQPLSDGAARQEQVYDGGPAARREPAARENLDEINAQKLTIEDSIARAAGVLASVGYHQGMVDEFDRLFELYRITLGEMYGFNSHLHLNVFVEMFELIEDIPGFREIMILTNTGRKYRLGMFSV